MNDDEQQRPVSTHSGYAAHQLARALITAQTHEDDDTRRRADERVQRWSSVVSGLAGGTLTAGSRTPVAGLPAWVTPEVVRGGFATGEASAGTPLLPYEHEAARRAGVPAERSALFAYALTDAGLAELQAVLDSGAYEVSVPEEAALLTVAWLVGAGDRLGALRLLEILEPFAGKLRFAPRPGPGSNTAGAEVPVVHRTTVGEASRAIAKRRPNSSVEAMREALTVWNPFADDLLTHWLETAESGRVLVRTPDDRWHAQGRALLERYAQLAAAHTRCGKHRNPKSNQAVMRTALARTLTGQRLDARLRGLLQLAVDSMVRRRGVPGCAQHTRLRERQAADGVLPSKHDLGQLVVRRLADLPQHTGTPEVEPFIGPVTEEEAGAAGLPAGAEIPESIRRTIKGALSAPVRTLIERGVVPSAEVLAELVPQLVAPATALAYDNAALRALMAANYQAFRNRRSLLLLNFEQQVRAEELPWVQAVAGYRREGAAGEAARTMLVHLGELALQAFPATVLPNPLVRELTTLAGTAAAGVPFVEELAADIFMGSFSGKFLTAARVAGELLGGTLYERYYNIDYELVVSLSEKGRSSGLLGTGQSPEQDFAELCRCAAGTGRSWSVAANGMVIEQAQILTTHNLATLAGPLGIAPAPGWADLARRCFATVCRLVERVHSNPRPLTTIKDAAYAWRQLVFYLSLCPAQERAAVLAGLDGEVARHPGHVATRLAPALAGLQLVAKGGRFESDGTALTESGRARRFLGWSIDGHWMRHAAKEA
ncbi:hypothetical protein AB8O64_36360 (plasmid) [Streptomyces sp. QH1-20]|uniref:hypothetical protein n=1 Tax=Streptomyces sp. QH1-20 TaxID=3240934 RepID=UPI003512C499